MMQQEADAGIRVRRLTDAERDASLAWLRQWSGASLYATPQFHRFLVSAAGGHAVTCLAEHAGRPVGMLTWMEHTVPGGGRVMNSLPWYGSHGSCIVDPRAPSGTREQLLAAYRAALEEPGLASATMILTPDEETHRSVYERAIPVRVRDDRIGQVTPLPADGAASVRDLERMIAPAKLRNVRKAVRQGFREVVSDEPAAWRFLHAVHVENMTAIGGRAKPWEHFVALREELPADWRRLSLAMLDDEPVAALLLASFNGTVEYLTPVIRHDARPLQPLSFLIWHAMLDAVAAGCHSWNWGGTWRTQVSLHRFKAGWGAIDRPYSYLVSAPDEGLRHLIERRDQIIAAVPYYYVYPFALLPPHPLT